MCTGARHSPAEPPITLPSQITLVTRKPWLLRARPWGSMGVSGPLPAPPAPHRLPPTGRLSHALPVMLLGREEGPPFWDRRTGGRRWSRETRWWEPGCRMPGSPTGHRVCHSRPHRTPSKPPSLQPGHPPEGYFLKSPELGVKRCSQDDPKGTIELEDELSSLTAHCVWPTANRVTRSVLGPADS